MSPRRLSELAAEVVVAGRTRRLEVDPEDVVRLDGRAIGRLERAVASPRRRFRAVDAAGTARGAAQTRLAAAVALAYAVGRR